MNQSDKPETPSSIQDVALIVGAGPGIGSSCARLFAETGMRVGIAARNPEKPVVCTENPIRVYQMIESAKLAR
jgi:NAD(P)-dependent dehydrogenase (short-subunit alcohol dehydrogenase family)